MNKKMLILPVTMLGLGLGACQPEEETAVLEMEEIADESVTAAEESEGRIEEEKQIEEEQEEAVLLESEEEHQNMLEKARREYAAEELDAAAGTLSVLLQNDLSDHSEIIDEGELLKEEIQDLQAEIAKDIAVAASEDSTYKVERQSAVLAEEYLTATGRSIREATDEELASWFAQKEITAQGEEETNSWTKEEAENYAFDQLIMLESLNYQKYFFFVNLIEEEWVQLEVRESVEQDGVSWSNLIGLYRYNVSTDELLKLDVVSGEYQEVH